MTEQAERDTRVEALRPGDRIRFLGRWFNVQRVFIGDPQPPDGRRWVYVITDIPEKPYPLPRPSGLTVTGPDAMHQPYKTFVYRPGVFVAAEIAEHEDEAAQ